MNYVLIINNTKFKTWESVAKDNNFCFNNIDLEHSKVTYKQ